MQFSQDKAASFVETSASGRARSVRDPESHDELIVENIRDYAIVMLDTAGKIRRWNVGAERMFGWRESEVLGQPVSILFTADDRSLGASEQELETARRTGSAPNERWQVRRDGSRFSGSGHTMDMRDTSGRHVGFVKMLRDVTEPRRTQAERERLLAASEDSTRTLRQWFDHAPGFTALLRGPAYVFEMANEAFYRIVGRRDLLGKPMFEVLPELREQGLGDILEKIFASGEPFVGQGVRLWLKREPDAPPAEVFVDFVYEPVIDANGSVSGIYVQGHDVTEQHRALAALRANQKRLERIFSHAAVGVSVADLQGRFLHANAAYQRITGYTEEELRTRTFLQITHPDDQAANQEQIARLLTGEVPDCVVEKRFVRRDGCVRWVRNSVTLIPESAAGAAWLILMVEDITSRKEAEAERERLLDELRTEKARTEDILESIHDAFYAVDADCCFTYVSHKAAQLWGRRREDLIGRNGWAEFPQVVGGESYEKHLEVMQTRRSARFETVSPTLGLTLDVSLYPAPRGGLSCYFRDITDRKRVEQALREADRRKDEFLAMLAHELRNPLAPLTNAHRLLVRTTALSEQGRAALAMAERQARQLTRLVDDLLEVSRITSGKIELRCEPTSVGAAVHLAVESLAALTDQRAQQIEIALPTSPVRVVADPARLAQILENLLNNASKYTPKGGTIRIEAHELSDEVEIRVIDNGVGIEADKIKQLFEFFSQIDATLDRAQGGLGIGLALVKRLTELHGGSVGATSKGLGEGATFFVRLPRFRDLS